MLLTRPNMMRIMNKSQPRNKVLLATMIHNTKASGLPNLLGKNKDKTKANQDQAKVLFQKQPII